MINEFVLLIVSFFLSSGFSFFYANGAAKYYGQGHEFLSYFGFSWIFVLLLTSYFFAGLYVLRLIFKNIKILTGIFFCCVLYFLVAGVGHMTGFAISQSKTNYWALEDSPEYLIIGKDGNSYIAGKYDFQNNQFLNSFKFIGSRSTESFIAKDIKRKDK